jgi:hypothetical protein
MQVPNSITVSPANSTVKPNGKIQFRAVVADQFGQPLVPQPPLGWTLNSGGGTITPSGSFTAGPDPGKSTVRVYGMHFGNVTGAGKVTVTPAAIDARHR